jgi:hypothetical protein
METETISARNIVDYLLEEHFQTSLCGPRSEAPVLHRRGPVTAWDAAIDLYSRLTKKGSDYVYGWDC